METEVNFFPRTLNLRRFVLRETPNFFLLMGTDKTLQNQHVITILKRDDSQRNYELKDIVLEDKKTYDPVSF